MQYPHPACDIYFNSDLHAVQTVWKYAVAGEEFRTILNNIVKVLSEKQCNIIIADARKLSSISKDDQEWIIKEWYPAALNAGFSLEALIVKKDTFNEYVIQKIVHHYDDEKVKSIYFHSYADAEKWIKENVQELHGRDNAM